MSLLTDFTAHLSKEHLFDPKGKLILAVSGGLDSMVLCDLCAQAGLDFSIAHCNFQLRGEESEADEQFVAATGSSYGKKVRVNRFDTERYAASYKLSIQAAARELRYQWFRQLVFEEGSGHHVLTAHHADDDLETIVMNFFRGTGLAGLRGILPVQGHLIRPLLPFHREQLEAYARERKLKWREDSSNLTDTYTRNFFRHQVLPLIQTRYPQAGQNILDNALRLGEVEQVYREAIGRYRKVLMKERGEEWHLSVGKLKGLKPIDTLLFELFHPFGFSTGQLPVLKELLDADTGRSVSSSTHRLLKNRKWLVLSPLKPTGQLYHHILETVPASLIFPEGSLRFDWLDASDHGLDPAPQHAYIDAKALQFPLLLRPWKEGDYFYPLGMKKKKKVARFLIDQKLSRNEKEKVWVLVSGDRLVWVIGHRIDDRFKLSPSTKQVCRVIFKSP